MKDTGSIRHVARQLDENRGMFEQGDPYEPPLSARDAPRSRDAGQTLVNGAVRSGVADGSPVSLGGAHGRVR